MNAPLYDELRDEALASMEWLGRIIFRDDAPDFEDPRRRFGYMNIPGLKDHPSFLHHWQLGAALQYGAKAVRLLLALHDVLELMREPVVLDELEAYFPLSPHDLSAASGASSLRSRGATLSGDRP